MGMSQRMANLNDIVQKYPGSYNAAFEVMATLMFMQRLNLPDPPVRRKNQAGIEADPVDIPFDIDSNCRAGKYAYQAKFFEPKTEISDRKKEFLKSIKIAEKEGVTELFFYVNKELRQKSKTHGKPSSEEHIRKAAMNANINLHWYTKKEIESKLSTPNYCYIREMFLNGEKAPDITGFYEHVCRKMTNGDSNAAYGSMSLLESYIEPLLRKRGMERKDSYVKEINSFQENSQNEGTQNVCDFFETWVDGDQYVTIFCGEPGHGKTSLCRKAMYDFYKGSWLKGKVLNVFTFSVNPAGTVIQDKKRLDEIEFLFSWGDTSARMKKGHGLDKEECGNALIFLDGFDELLEWIPDYDLDKFLYKVFLFLENFDSYKGYDKPHIVITTRKMALDPRKDEYIVSTGRGVTQVPIYEMQLIPKERQFSWIEKHGNSIFSEVVRKGNLSNIITDMSERACLTDYEYHENIDTSVCKSYLNEYKKMYENLAPQDELKQILGIPIIFRMIVMQNYIPESQSDLSSIYEELFEITWKRNSNRANENHDMAYMKKKLMRHALSIYLDNNDSAEVSDKIGDEEASWLYAFYTRYEKSNTKHRKSKFKSRVGFLHKTLYEHFLACEILSWFQCIDENGEIIIECKQDNNTIDRNNTETFQDRLSLLGKRKLSGEILSSIRELYKRGQETDKGEWIEDEAFETAYNILKKTDGILRPLLFNKLTEGNDVNTPLVRGENVFFNVISICSVCNHPVSSEKINVRALQYYDLAGVRLDGANFRKANLESARFANAFLVNTDFTGAKLNQAYLSEAVLSGRFDDSSFSQANLTGATLSGSFANADFKRASLSDANLSGSLFNSAEMEGALLSCTIFKKGKVQAKVSEVNIDGSRISQAVFSDEQTKSIDMTRVIGKPLKMQDGRGDYEISVGRVTWTDDLPIKIEKNAKMLGMMRYDSIPAFGRYMQGGAGEIEPLSWIILKKETNRVLAITEKLIDCICYNDTWTSETTWADCSLREWLNEDFLYGFFTKNERARIIRYHNQNYNSQSYDADDDRPTWDKIFSLSIEEVEQYFETDMDRRAAVTAYVRGKESFSDEHFSTISGKIYGWWWLRSLGRDRVDAAHVYHSGAVNGAGDYVNKKGICVRPALWLDTTS